MTISATQWLVLDNVKQGWRYWTNCNRDKADVAYLWCINNELIRHGAITALGVLTLIENAKPKEPAWQRG